MLRIIVLMLAASLCNGDVDAGLSAYNRGDYAKAFQIWSNDANTGDPHAQYHLALLYRDGQGVTRDPAAAMQWLEKSAQQGYSYSQTELAWFLEQGVAAPADPKKAREWYQRAAYQGNFRAMNNLGLMYYEGRGGPPDYERAFDLFQRASEGSAAAQYNLGLMYETGTGPTKDLVESCAWYSLAAEKGSKGAPAKRDKIKQQLSPQEQKVLRSRIAQIHRIRAWNWLKKNWSHSAWVLLDLLVFGVYLVVIADYVLTWSRRRNWFRASSPDADRLLRQRTGSLWRRWLLLYKPSGLFAWCLHVIFFAVLITSLVFAMALATLPIDEGWILLACLLIALVLGTHAAAVHRDRRMLAQELDR